MRVVCEGESGGTQLSCARWCDYEYARRFWHTTALWILFLVGGGGGGELGERENSGDGGGAARFFLLSPLSFGERSRAKNTKRNGEREREREAEGLLHFLKIIQKLGRRRESGALGGGFGCPRRGVHVTFTYAHCSRRDK